MIKSDLVRLMNEQYARLRLEARRTDELPIELEQLSQAIETVNAKVAFDTDVSDFRVALLALAAEPRRG